jgi:hypothetical protein
METVEAAMTCLKAGESGNHGHSLRFYHTKPDTDSTLILISTIGWHYVRQNINNLD